MVEWCQKKVELVLIGWSAPKQALICHMDNRVGYPYSSKRPEGWDILRRMRPIFGIMAVNGSI